MAQLNRSNFRMFKKEPLNLIFALKSKQISVCPSRFWRCQKRHLAGAYVEVAYAGVKEPEVGVFEAVFSPDSSSSPSSPLPWTRSAASAAHLFGRYAPRKSLYTPELAGVSLRYLKGPVHIVFLGFFCKINHAPLPNIVKNPISNFGSCKLTWKTPICQIICMNSQKSLAKKFFLYISFENSLVFFLWFFKPAIWLDRLTCATRYLIV